MNLHLPERAQRALDVLSKAKMDWHFLPPDEHTSRYPVYTPQNNVVIYDVSYVVQPQCVIEPIRKTFKTKTGKTLTVIDGGK